MTLGALMLDLDGLSLSDEEVLLLQNPDVGGVIFFARNFESRDQIARLVQDIRSVRPELLICVDQEGGRVQRFQAGFTRIPPMQVLGDKLAAGDLTTEQVKDAGWLMASELLACGLDFSFAPVLDVDRDRCEVISNRSFSDNPQDVVIAAEHFMAGMHEAGMATTGKHFPGHGGVVADSHLETPYDDRPLAVIRDRDMVPFQALKSSLDAVMPAHIVFPAIDSESVGFSSFWLQQILRQELQFDGVIFSDDLAMKGADVAGGFTDKAKAALSAGCDMVLVCNHREGALEVLEYLNAHTDKYYSDRLPTMSARKSPQWDEVVSSSRWRQTMELFGELLGECG